MTTGLNPTLVTSREDISNIFKTLDEDNKGYITLDTLKKIADEFGEKIAEEDLKQIMEKAAREGSEKITADDFYDIMTRATFT